MGEGGREAVEAERVDGEDGTLDSGESGMNGRGGEYSPLWSWYSVHSSVHARSNFGQVGASHVDACGKRTSNLSRVVLYSAIGKMK